jgi:hypothetical protein
MVGVKYLKFSYKSEAATALPMNRRRFAPLARLWERGATEINQE